MKRTAENIYKRKDGRFEGRYTVLDDENGDAQFYDGKTFREAAQNWLDNRRDEIAPTTYSRYVEALKRDIYRNYADTLVKDIDESEIGHLEQADVTFEKNPYEALSPSEIKRVCVCARYNYTPEMLAVMLTLFCGIRTGEVCALNRDDVSLARTGENISKR